MNEQSKHGALAVNQLEAGFPSHAKSDVSPTEKDLTAELNTMTIARLPKALEETAATFPHFGTPEEEEKDEREWAQQFAASKDVLKQLAAEARTERRQGKTLPLKSILDD